jgi:mannose-1-phosphate guanylyltransferase/mannose-6-phosphate isomerase
VVIVEPMGRNTAPAVAAAALLADSEDVLVILPADHLIRDTGAFQDGVRTAVRHALAGSIVAFGITPTRAETGYGYIETGDSVGDGWQVARFKEKPAVEEAGEMVADGRHLWNSGMFVAVAGTLIDEMAGICPALLEKVRGAVPTSIEGLAVLGPSFGAVEAISFDHAVMERTGRAVVIPLDVGWDDIGSYQALMGLSAKDGEGNAVSGPVVLENVTGSFIHATTRTVAVAGMSDVIVVEAADGVLVVPLSEAQRVKDLAERAQNQR